MNVHDRDIAAPQVTTGPIAGSRKIYAVPDTAADLRVPVREIVLTEASGEPPVPVYDTSGPYTDNNVAIDVEAGLKRARTAWVRERGGIEEYDGRPIRPVDNGNVTGKHLARAFPTVHRPLRAVPGKPVTQYEWARAGIITKEMIYVAERENLGRKRMLDRAEAALADGESFGAAVPAFVTPEFVRSEVARASPEQCRRTAPCRMASSPSQSAAAAARAASPSARARASAATPSRRSAEARAEAGEPHQT